MKEWKKVLLLTAAGLLFRLIHYLLFAKHVIPGGDQIQNILLARNFASGDFYGVLDTYWSPLYPILIGFLTLFIDSPVAPSVIISIIAGSLAVPLTYYFVKQSYGPTEALIAGGITVFYAHLINSVFKLGTENIFLLLIIGSLYVGWKGLEKSSSVLYLLSGCLIGLAYLTRPEAIGYIAFFILFALVKDLWKRKRFSGVSLKLAIAFLIGFMLFATPYLVYLRAETGTWTVSGKISLNVAGGHFHEGDEIDEEEAEEEIAEAAEREPWLNVATIFFLNLVRMQEILAFLVPVLLMLFIGLGIFGQPWNSERTRRESYLIVFCAVTVVGYAIAVVQARYFYILLPVFFGWIACGVTSFQYWLKESVANLIPLKYQGFAAVGPVSVFFMIFVYLYLFPLNFYSASEERLWKTNRYEERNAGLWIKQNSGPDPLIFTASRTPILYAGGEQISPNTRNREEEYLRIKKARPDFVVVSERTSRRNPYLKGLDNVLLNDSDFELVFEDTKKNGYEIYVFQRK